MKRCLFLLLTIGAALGLGAQNVYDWNRVDTLVGQGRYASARPIVADYQAAAASEGNGAERLNALFYLTMIDEAVEAHALDSSIARYAALESELQGAEKSVAGVMLMQQYAELIQQKNWYSFSLNAKSNDPDLSPWRWDKSRFVDTMDALLARIVPNLGQAAALAGRLRFVTPGPADDLELALCHNMLASIGECRDHLQFIDPAMRQALYSPLTELADYPMPAEAHLLARFFHQMALLHRNDAPARRLRLDLDRLQKVKDMTQDGDFWEAAAERLLGHYGPLNAEPHDMAELHYLLGSMLKKGDRLAAAHSIFQQAEERYPNTVQAADCRVERLKIEMPYHEMTTQSEEHSQRNRMARVSYRNLSQLQLRIVKYEPWMETYRYRHQQADTMLTLPAVKEWVQQLPAYDDYGLHYAVIAIPMLPNGEYVLLSSDAADSTGAPSSNWKEGNVYYCKIVSSDAMFVTYEESLSQQVYNTEGWLVDRASGLPIPNQKVHIQGEYCNRRILYFCKADMDRSRRTDINGHFDFHTERGWKPNSYDCQMYVDLDGFRYNRDGFLGYSGRYIYGRRWSSYTLTKVFPDKPVYKLGEEVRFSCMAYKVSPSNSLKAAKGKKIKIIFEDPEDDEIGNLTLTTDEFGQCSGPFTLPKEGRNGEYLISAKGSSTSIEVEDYKLPRFAVTLAADGGQRQFGKPVTLKGMATAYNGSSLEGSKVAYSVRARRGGVINYDQRIQHDTIELGRNGEFEITFTPQPEEADTSDNIYTFRVEAVVTSPDGESQKAESQIRVGRHSQFLSLDPASSNDTLRWRFQDIDQCPIEGKVRVVVERLRQPADCKPAAPLMRNYPNAVWAGSEEEFHQLFPHYALHREEWDSTLWESEAVVADIVSEHRYMAWPANLGSAAYRVTLMVGDSLRHVEVVNHRNYSDHKAIGCELLAMEAPSHIVCHKGDTLRIPIISAYKNQPVYYKAMLGKKTLLTGMMLVDGDSQPSVLEIPVTRKMEGRIVLTLSAVREGRSMNKTVECYIYTEKPTIKVEAETFRDKIRPGEQEEWRFRVTGAESNHANLMLSLYDKSLDVVSHYGLRHYMPPKYLKPSYYTRLDANSFLGRLENLRSIVLRPNPTSGAVAGDSLMPQRPTLVNPRYYRYQLMEGYDTASLALLSKGNGVLRGIVRDNKTKEELPLVSVIVKRGHQQVAGAQTDFDGIFRIKNLAPGTYDLEVSYVGYRKYIKTGVKVKESGFTVVNFDLEPSATLLEEVVICEYKVPVIEIRAPESGQRLSSDDIARMSGISESVVASVGGVGYSGTARGESGMVQIESVEMEEEIAYEEAAAQSVPLQIRENLNTSAFFMPSLRTDDSGRVSITFTAPEALAQWHLKGLAWDKTMTGGELDLTTCTQKELMVQPQVPRFFRQGDTIDFRTRVSNLTDTAQQVRVTLEFGSRDTFSVSQQQMTTVPGNGSSTVSFRLYVPDTLHVARYRITARSSRYADGEQAEVPVLGNRVRVTESRALYINGKAGEKVEKHYSLTDFTHQPTGAETDSLTLLFCSNPIWYAMDAAPHLAMHISPSNLYTANRIYANTIECIAQGKKPGMAIRLALEKLSREQHGDGGWSWMPGGKESNPYVTRRILQQLGEMEDIFQTYSTPRPNWMMRDGARYLEWRIGEMDADTTRTALTDYEMMDYLYVHSLVSDTTKADSTTRAAITRQYRKALSHRSKITSLRLRAQLALTALHYGDTALARDEAIRLKECALRSDEMGMYWRDNLTGLYWWDRPIETQALMVEVFAKVLQDWESVGLLQQWILKQRQATTWGSDMATASAIKALCCHSDNKSEAAPQVELTVGSNKLEPKADSLKYGHYEVHWNGAEAAKTVMRSPDIKISRNGTGSSWGAVYYQYDEQLDKVAHNEMGIRLDRHYYRVNADKSLTLVTDTTRLSVGDRLRVVIAIECDRTLDHLELADQRAAAFDPISTQSGWHYNGGLNYYMDVRNEESRMYIDRLIPGSYTAEYDVRVMASGVFASGIATIKCCYAPEFRANSGGATFLVEQ